MIVRSNLPRLCKIAGSCSRVLDVGGWFQPFNLATHVLDIGSYETRHKDHALDPENAERFTADTWIVHDVCSRNWPFPDKFFDFVFCSHLLEDVRDPIGVCQELCRVAKAGYVETPSRLREIFSKEWLFTLKCLFGNVPEVGFCHHRWFIEAEGSHLRFTPKTTQLLENRAHYLTRFQVGRKLTPQESAMVLWWENDFTYEEVFGDPSVTYPQFRQKALGSLRRR